MEARPSKLEPMGWQLQFGGKDMTHAEEAIHSTSSGNRTSTVQHEGACSDCQLGVFPQPRRYYQRVAAAGDETWLGALMGAG